MAYANDITELIGNTPLVKLKKASVNGATVLGKCEFLNPTHSVKDRIGFNMINEALKSGLINKDTTVIEPTSGNTGIALASICAALGIKLILTMPSSMSIERRKLLHALGAKLVLTEPEKGMKGAIERAAELTAENPKAWSPKQFDNPANVAVHERTTAQEILADFPNGLDYVITGVGTGGHITGVAKVLKAKFPNIKIIAVEPELSPVLSGGTHSPHPLQGIGAGFVPSIYNSDLIDEVIQVSKDDAFEYARRIAKEEGILVGISTGASLAAVSKKLETIPDGAVVLTFNYDTGERYLSIEGLF